MPVHRAYGYEWVSVQYPDQRRPEEKSDPFSSFSSGRLGIRQARSNQRAAAISPSAAIRLPTAMGRSSRAARVGSSASHATSPAENPADSAPTSDEALAR